MNPESRLVFSCADNCTVGAKSIDSPKLRVDYSHGGFRIWVEPDHDQERRLQKFTGTRYTGTPVIVTVGREAGLPVVSLTGPLRA